MVKKTIKTDKILSAFRVLRKAHDLIDIHIGLLGKFPCAEHFPFEMLYLVSAFEHMLLLISRQFLCLPG